MLRSRHLSFIAGLLLASVVPGIAAEGQSGSTSFVREFAKCEVKVYLITSGPQAAAIAKSLQDDILTNRDAKPNQRTPDKAPILTLEAAEREAATNPKFNDATRIFLLIGKELAQPLPVKLAGLCPVDAGQISSTSSSIVARNLVPKAGKLAFSIGISAPDEERLRKLVGVFNSHSFPGYRSMLATYTEAFDTVRLAVFSDPKNRTSVEHWGRLNDPKVWFNSEWHALSDYAKLTPEDLRECRQVFFIDRSQPDTTLPPPAAQLLANATLKETTILIQRGKAADGGQIAVFSAPTDLALAKKAQRFARFEALPDGPVIEELTDLRKIGRTTLLVLGVSGQASSEDLEWIRLELARNMRTRLNTVVEERGPIWQQLEREVAFQDLQGATNRAKRLRQQSGVRYVWVLRLLDYGGNTSYAAAEKMTSGPAPTYTSVHPDDPEPPEPVLGLFQGRGKKAQHEEEMAKWKPVHDQWLARAENHRTYCEQQAPCQFERTVTRSCVGHVKGILSLIDLNHAAVPVWEKELDGRRSMTSVFASDRITVNGYNNHPASLTSPPTEDKCPSAVVQEAALNAGAGGIAFLQETAWISDKAVEEKPKEPDPPTKPGKNETDSPETPVASVHAPFGAKVADIDKERITLKIDPASGVRVGDKALVALRVKIVNDPDDPAKVLSQTVVETLTLRIVTVKDNMAEAVAMTPQAKAGLDRVKVGMGVKCEHVPPAAPPVKPPTKHPGKQSSKRA